MDPSSLTKEQLLELLRLKEESESNNVTERCKFMPLRGAKVPCTENSTTPYGFCKKHSRTVQSKRAKEEWEMVHVEKQKEPEPVEEPEPAEEKIPPQLPNIVEKKSVKQIKTKTIRKNYWGRYEDPVTGICFDKDTREAYGVQDRVTGRIKPLSKEHISICNKKGWKYYVPTVDEESPDEESEEESSEDEESEEESGDSSGSSEKSEEEDSDEESEEEDSGDSESSDSDSE